MSMQSSLNFLIPLLPGQEPAISAIINSSDLDRSLGKIDTLHFLALAVVPVSLSPTSKEALLLEANIDGDCVQFLSRLWHESEAVLSSLFKSCDTEIPDNAEQFISALAHYDQGQGIAHTALPGVDLNMIHHGVHLQRVLRKSLQEQQHEIQTSEQACELLLADTNVQNALFATPPVWPGERLKQRRKPIATILSLALSMLLLCSTALSPLPALDVKLPGALLLELLLFASAAITILAIPSETKVPSQWLMSSICAVLFLLVLCQLFRRELPLETLLFYGYPGLMLILGAYALNAVPTTAGSEQFFKHAFWLTLCFALLIVTLAEFGSGPAAFAAQQWWLLLVLAILGALASFAHAFPLPLIEPRAVVLGVGLYLVLPIAIPSALHYIAVLLGMLLLILFCVLGYMACLLQAQEQRDSECAPLWEPGEVRTRIAQFESQRSNRHNHLISLTHIKPGLLRALAIRLTLNVVGLAAAFSGKRGELSGIVTIHFARWILVGRGRTQLLFLSNYCGNWDSYLDEFIDHASPGITSIWSNTVGCPRSAWLTEGGAQSGERFKLFARRSQPVTLYHYSAYPDVTVDQIEDILRVNALLRADRRTREECEEVLRIL